MREEELISIFLIIVVFLVLGVLMYYWVVILRTEPDTGPAPQYTLAGYGMRCLPGGSEPSPIQYNPQPCDVGLTCVVQPGSAFGYCKKSLGAACSSILECVPDAKYCTGYCSTSTVGGLNQACVSGSCNDESLRCVEQPTLPPEVCKVAEFASGCYQSSDCADGRCQLSGTGPGTCFPQYNNGYPCNGDLDCRSGCCSPSSSIATYPSNPSTYPSTLNGGVGGGGEASGFCQDVLEGDICVANGVQGATCYYPGQGVPGCNAGLVCGLEMPIADAYGMCSIAQEKWPSGVVCSVDAGCLPPTICWRGACIYPQTDSYYLVNECGVGTSHLCTGGYSCISGSCLGLGEVPDIVPGEAPEWALFHFIEEGAGRWLMLAAGISRPNPGSLSILQGDWRLGLFSVGDIWYLYSSLTGGDQLWPLTITGDITPERIWFTPAGQLSFQYISTGGGTRVWLQPYPSSWRTTTPETTLSFGSSGRGGYPGVTIHVDVDDRPDQSGNIRVLLVSSSAAIYLGYGTQAQINEGDATFTVAPGGPFSWGGFYSGSRLIAYPNALYSLDSGASTFRFSDIDGRIQSAGYPPVLGSVTPRVLAQSLYSSLGSGPEEARLFYLISAGGQFVLRAYDNGAEVALPGRVDATAIPVVSVQVPGYYLLARRR